MKTSRMKVVAESVHLVFLFLGQFRAMCGSRGYSQSQVGGGGSGQTNLDRAHPRGASACLLQVMVSLTFSGFRKFFPVSWFLITIQEAYL